MKSNFYRTLPDLPHKRILSIDLKCFYASVECVDRGLDPFATPLVVADRERGSGTIVLAVSPYLKALGLPSRMRVYELPKIDHLIFARPRMQRYLNMSAEVVGIFLDYIDQKDIHVYSIDESFLDVTAYQEVERLGVRRFAKRIMRDIKNQLGLTVTTGIGENIFMAKAAMDIEAKKNPDFLASWTYEDIPHKLWPVAPLSQMWGIGPRLQKRLNFLGFFSIGDIAASDIDFFRAQFGVIGEEIYNHAHGIDYAEIREIYIPKDKSISVSQVLFEDYEAADALVVVLEMTEELIYRLRQQQKLTASLGLYIGYTRSEGGGFHNGVRLAAATDEEDVIRESFRQMFLAKKTDKKIRKIGLAAFDLCSNLDYQLDLFSDYRVVEKKRELAFVLDQIRRRYGFDKVTKATSLLEKSNFSKRSDEIGGHHK